MPHINRYLCRQSIFVYSQLKHSFTEILTRKGKISWAGQTISWLLHSWQQREVRTHVPKLGLVSWIKIRKLLVSVIMACLLAAVMISFHGTRKQSQNLTQNIFMVRKVGSLPDCLWCTHYQFFRMKKINTDVILRYYVIAHTGSKFWYVFECKDRYLLNPDFCMEQKFGCRRV